MTAWACTGSKLTVMHRARVHDAAIASRNLGVILTGTRLIILDLSVLAVWHFRKKDAVITLRVEYFLSLGNDDFILLVLTWTRVISRWELLVLNIDGRFEHLSCLLGSLKVTDRSSLFSSMKVWVIQSWADCVEATSSIHV